MKFKGKVHKFGNDVNTDEIIPAVYLDTTDAKELGVHCMEGIDKDFAVNVKKGDIIVGGKNFGCGSSREHAPLSIKGAGVSCVIAESFARIFYRNCINIGLPIIEDLRLAKNIKEKDTLEVDIGRGEVKDLTKQKKYHIPAFPEFMQKLIDAGGLMKWTKKNTK